MDAMMELAFQYTFLIASSVIAFLLALLVGLLSWLGRNALRATTEELKGLKASDDRLSQQIGELRSELPEKYVLKSDSLMFREEVRQTLSDISKMIREEFKDMRDLLDSKVDKK